MDGVLDPATESLKPGSQLRTWWELQRRFALRPEHVPDGVRCGRPEGALAQTRFAPWGDEPSEALRGWLAERRWFAIPLASARYPAALAAIADPPVLLWVRGDLEALEPPRVAIVGARRCTGYGEGCAETLARGLAQESVIIVSGLARGVDAAAHRGALRSGRTAAVLAHGPDTLYPASHRGLADAIARSGLLVSEFPPGLSPRKPFFPLRNRTISGLSAAVVVVEARRRSGSLATARHALGQGREVLAVPGPIDVETSEGANLLLRDGASLALEASDVLRAIGLGASTTRARREPESTSPKRPEASQGPDGARALLSLLHRGPASLDALAAELSQDADAIARAVVELELADLVETASDGSVSLRRG